MNAIISFLIEHWVSVSAVVAAIGARLFPTEKNYDIFTKVLKLLDLIVPNLKKGGGRHGILKAILFFALASVSVNSFAQLNTKTRQIRFATGVQFAADTAETLDNRGRVWYDFDTHHYRANFNGSNAFFGEGSGGGGNFWPLSGVGTLTGDVTIDDDGNQITFDTHSSNVRVRSATDNNQYISLRPDGIVSTYDGIGNFFLLTSSGLNWGGAQEAQQTITSPTNVGHITFTNNSGNTTDIKGGQIKSTLLTDQTMLFSASNIITGENALSYNSSLNRILLSNTAGTFASSIFGGEIQLDDITNSDDVTLNNAGISVTGLVTPYQIVSDGDIEINSDNLTLQSTAGDLSINSSANISVSPQTSFDLLVSGLGSSELSMTSTDVTLTAPDEMDIIGTSVSIAGNVSLIPTNNNSQLYSGTYNPTATAVTNVSTVVANGFSGYSRVGNMVTVHGITVCTPTAGGGAESIWTITLPIASDFTNTVDCTGTFSGREDDGSPVTQFPGQILADVSGNVARFSFSSSSTTDITFSYIFQYIVK